MNWEMLGADANRLARAEASRTPNSDLNMLNASFGTDRAFRAALRRAIEGGDFKKRYSLDADVETVYCPGARPDDSRAAQPRAPTEECR